MPKTYTDRGISSNNIPPRTSIFHKPEPPKPIKRYIGGLEVDESTYSKYNREDYRLGDGIFRNLRSVMVYANSAELAAEYPEQAEVASGRHCVRIRRPLNGSVARLKRNGEPSRQLWMNCLERLPVLNKPGIF